VDIFEIGTGKLTFSVPLNFTVSSLSWSPDGKYLSVIGGRDRTFKVFQVDKQSQENIWTIIDQMKRSKEFWA